MGKELEEANVRELAEELNRFGFPASLIADMKEQMKERRRDVLIVPFETAIQGQPVKGNIYLHKEQSSGLYKFDHFYVDLRDSSTARYKERYFDPSDSNAYMLGEAVNLMDGRSVFHAIPGTHPQQGHWFWLGPEEYEKNLPIQNFTGDLFRPKAAIRESPLVQWIGYEVQNQLATQLERGDRARVEVGTRGLERAIYITFNPGNGVLEVSDKNGKAMTWDEVQKSVKVEVPEMRLGRGR